MSELKIINGKYHPVFIDDTLKSLNQFLSKKKYSTIIILTDRNTKKYCLNKFIQLSGLKKFHSISISCGEENKVLVSAENIWKQLLSIADRKSVLINLGGGMVTDLGGFAASVFKRGIDFIHVPTTLLAMVDASIGSKTGIDFMNYKNQLGIIMPPQAVFISTIWLQTLPQEQIKSANAEIAKHAMLSGIKNWKKFIISNKIVDSNINEICISILFKLEITDQDLFENGLRKQLNFGHTIGHALESFQLSKNKPISHGFAIAAGMICEIYLSCMVLKQPENIFKEQLDFLKSNFPKIDLKLNDLKKIQSFIYSDKKNSNGKIIPVLLNRIGKPKWKNEVTMAIINKCLLKYLNG